MHQSLQTALVLQDPAGTPRIGWWLFVAALIVGAIVWLNARRRP